MLDNAQQTHYFSNTVIDPKGKYTYDSLYRLLKAKGRELTGLNAPTASRYTPDFVPTDGQSNQTLQTYCEQYTYDALGNILELSHRDTCGGTENWKRTYQYNTNKPNNYLQKAYTGSTPPTSPQFTYDAHGNMLVMPHLNAMTWDFEDQLKTTEKTGETTYYVYAGGERVRKVCYNTATDKIKHERIYLSDYEIYREYDASEDLELERTSNHVMDDRNRIAILEVKTLDNGTAIAPGNQVTIARYQYSNHLGSACLELNETAETISYQEYHPFGSTSYELHTNDSEVSLKRNQYVGKERDDESGLYYYGARYYADWLCRFVSVDPLKDDYPYYTTYQYAGNKPVSFFDLDGKETAPNHNTNTSPNGQQLQAGLTFDFTFGGGLAISAYAGYSYNWNFLTSAVYVSATLYGGGVGTSTNSPELFNLTVSPSLTFGFGNADPRNINTFNSLSGSGIFNTFNTSLTTGQNFIFSSGTTAEGGNRNQRTAYLGFRTAGVFSAGTSNDVQKLLFGVIPILWGDGNDEFHSANIHAELGYQGFLLRYTSDMY